MRTEPSAGVCKRIRDSYPGIDPVEFHEFVREQLSLTYADAQGLTDKAQIPRVIEFIIEGEEDHFLDSHMDIFKESKKRQGEINETIKIKALVPVKAKPQEENTIDRPVKPGGLTLVHTMVEDRNLAGLKEAHEGYGAKLDVRDNSGQFPIDLARSLGFVEIVTYIEERLAGAMT